MPRQFIVATCAVVLLVVLAITLASSPTQALPPLPTRIPTPTAAVLLPQVLSEYPPPYFCHADLYNCADFDSQAEAQEAFEYCLARTGRDVHRLDADDDGCACECNPDPRSPGCPRSDYCP